MARLTQADWKLIRHHLGPFRHFNGVGSVLAKVEENIVEGDSEYIKVVRIEFLADGAADPDSPAHDPLAPPAPAPAAPTADGAPEQIRRLMSLGCRVLSRDSPRYLIQVPHDGDEFNETIDLLEALHLEGRIRYLR